MAFTVCRLDLVGRKIGGSAVMCMLINAVSKAPVKENLPRPIPGYGIRWNIKLQCWSRLYNAREVSKNLCFCIPLSFIHPDLNNVLLF